MKDELVKIGGHHARITLNWRLERMWINVQVLGLWIEEKLQRSPYPSGLRRPGELDEPDPGDVAETRERLLKRARVEVRASRK